MSHSQELERLLERFEAHPDGRIFAPLADCYRKMGRLDEALQVCQEGLGKHADYSSAHVILGKIFQDREEMTEARDAFERVLEIDPGNLLARRQLAELAEADGRVEDALEAWQHLASFDPNDEFAQARVDALWDEIDPDHGRDQDDIEYDEPDAEDDDLHSGGTEADAPVAEEEDEVPVAVASEPEVTGDEDVDADADDESAPELDTEETVAAVQEVVEASADQEAQDIATSTLADIYYDQGFKEKALAIYEQLAERAGDSPGLAAKIGRIRGELAQIETRAAQQTTPEQAGLADAEESEGVLSARFVDEGPGAGARGQEKDSEERDFANFKNWLDRNKT